MTTTLNHFLQEQEITAAISNSGLTEEIQEQAVNGEWSEGLSADELLKALDCDSDIQKM